jgi:hypothetical protein
MNLQPGSAEHRNASVARLRRAEHAAQFPVGVAAPQTSGALDLDHWLEVRSAWGHLEPDISKLLGAIDDLLGSISGPDQEERWTQEALATDPGGGTWERRLARCSAWQAGFAESLRNPRTRALRTFGETSLVSHGLVPGDHRIRWSPRSRCTASRPRVAPASSPSPGGCAWGVPLVAGVSGPSGVGLAERTGLEREVPLRARRLSKPPFQWPDARARCYHFASDRGVPPWPKSSSETSINPSWSG